MLRTFIAPCAPEPASVRSARRPGAQRVRMQSATWGGFRHEQAVGAAATGDRSRSRGGFMGRVNCLALSDVPIALGSPMRREAHLRMSATAHKTNETPEERDLFPLPTNPEDHPTSNVQRRTSNGSAHLRSLRCSVFDVGRSMFSLGSGVSTRTFSFREIPSPGKRAGVRADVTFLPRHRNVAKIVNRES